MNRAPSPGLPGTVALDTKGLSLFSAMEVSPQVDVGYLVLGFRVAGLLLATSMFPVFPGPGVRRGIALSFLKGF